MTLPLVISPGDPGHIGDHEEMHALLAAAVSPFDNVALDGAGTLAARPAAGTQGRYYFATDTGVLYRDTGTAWSAISTYISDLIVNILSAAPTVSGMKVPTARVGKSAGQAIADGINGSTVVTFDVETSSTTWDNDNIHSISSNTGRLVAPRDGYYIVGCAIVFESNATGDRFVRLRHGPSGNLFARDDRVANSGSDYITMAGITEMDAGEYAEVIVSHSAGTAIDVLGGSSMWMAHQSDK